MTTGLLIYYYTGGYGEAYMRNMDGIIECKYSVVGKPAIFLPIE